MGTVPVFAHVLPVPAIDDGPSANPVQGFLGIF
jgi:hypothetical protein